MAVTTHGLDGLDERGTDAGAPHVMINDEFLELRRTAVGVQQGRDRRQGVPRHQAGGILSDKQNRSRLVVDKKCKGLVEGLTVRRIAGRELLEQEEYALSIFGPGSPNRGLMIDM